MTPSFSSSKRSSSDQVCPHCGEPLKAIPLLYGYPAPEAFEQAERGELVIGSCMVGDIDPPFACAAYREPLWPTVPKRQ
jgi:hypothetical protein